MKSNNSKTFKTNCDNRKTEKDINKKQNKTFMPNLREGTISSFLACLGGLFLFVCCVLGCAQKENRYYDNYDLDELSADVSVNDNQMEGELSTDLSDEEMNNDMENNDLDAESLWEDDETMKENELSTEEGSVEVEDYYGGAYEGMKSEITNPKKIDTESDEALKIKATRYIDQGKFKEAKTIIEQLESKGGKSKIIAEELLNALNNKINN